MPKSRLGINGERLEPTLALTRRDPRRSRGPSAISACWVGIHGPSHITSALRTRPLKEIIGNTRLGDCFVRGSWGARTVLFPKRPRCTDFAAMIFRRLTQGALFTALREEQPAPGQLSLHVNDVPQRAIHPHPNQDRRGISLNLVSGHISAGFPSTRASKLPDPLRPSSIRIEDGALRDERPQ